MNLLKDGCRFNFLVSTSLSDIILRKIVSRAYEEKTLPRSGHVNTKSE